jgi:type 1 fimbria pilin
MTGNIYANTCIIDSASRNLTVDLGQAASGDFKDVGDTGEWKDFSLSVSHARQARACHRHFTVRRTARTRLNSPISAAQRGWRWSWPTARTISHRPAGQL